MGVFFLTASIHFSLTPSTSPCLMLLHRNSDTLNEHSNSHHWVLRVYSPASYRSWPRGTNDPLKFNSKKYDLQRRILLPSNGLSAHKNFWTIHAQWCDENMFIARSIVCMQRHLSHPINNSELSHSGTWALLIRGRLRWHISKVQCRHIPDNHKSDFSKYRHVRMRN